MSTTNCCDDRVGILATLRAGRPVYADRQSGKTSTLLEFIRENQNVAGSLVIVPTAHLVRETLRMWSRMTADPPPRVMAAAALQPHGLAGTDYDVYIDERGLCGRRLDGILKWVRVKGVIA
jgi:hypothetical protein